MSELPKHIQGYFDFFDLEPGDWVGSEISNATCQDFHHIYEKGMGGRPVFEHEGVEYDINSVENIIALTREEHEDAHANVYTKEQLWNLHQKVMRNHLELNKWN